MHGEVSSRSLRPFTLIFNSKFCGGVQTSCSESVSDVKGSAAGIFGLSGDFLVRGYSRIDEPQCRELLLGPNGKYTKFAPVLFPNPKNMLKDEFLKAATLVKVCNSLRLVLHI